MPAKKQHKRLTKKEYILQKIDVLSAEIYQNEIARDYVDLVDKKDQTDEQKKSINAANHNIERLNKQIEWLEANLG
jgi:hypothetical protein